MENSLRVPVNTRNHFIFNLEKHLWGFGEKKTTKVINWNAFYLAVIIFEGERIVMFLPIIPWLYLQIFPPETQRIL